MQARVYSLYIFMILVQFALLVGLLDNVACLVITDVRIISISVFF